jgi:hypothetical protein
MRKLKPSSLNVETVIGITVGMFAVLLVLLMGLILFFALAAMLTFFCMVITFLIFIRTKNSYQLIVSLFFLSCTSVSVSVILFGFESAHPILFGQGVIALLLAFWSVYLVFTRKVKWKTREILELAAIPVQDTSAGYTQRPLSVGRVTSSYDELLTFSSFLHRNLIAVPYIENGSIVLSFSSKLARQIGLLTDYLDTTWVRFDQQGNVTVNISRTDYLLYKDELSFDQLCDSLGKLIIEFHDQFLSGEGIRIIDKINSLRLNPLTE